MNLLFFSKQCNDCKELIQFINSNLAVPDNSLKFILLDDAELISIVSPYITEVPSAVSIDPTSNVINSIYKGVDESFKYLKSQYPQAVVDTFTPPQQQQQQPPQQPQQPPQQQYQPPQQQYQPPPQQQQQQYQPPPQQPQQYQPPPQQQQQQQPPPQQQPPYPPQQQQQPPYPPQQQQPPPSFERKTTNLNALYI